MPKTGNKIISYSVYDRSSGRAQLIGDTTSIQLPSIEFLTDTIKGAGVLGEVDLPSYMQPGSMTLAINIRVSNEEFGKLCTAKDLEIRWVSDVFNSNEVKTEFVSNKAFIKCIPKKLDEGKLEPGSTSDGSFEYEVFAYKRILNGKEVLNIDKFNCVFAIDGKNLAKDYTAYL